MSSLKRDVNRLVGQAIHAYHLLENGDRILVAVSGGADSLLVLWFLRHWLHKAPITYRLFPVYLDMGFGGSGWRSLRLYLESEGYPCHLEQTDYGRLAHGPFNRGKSPCFLCSMWRRKRLFELARCVDCNKIAFGHNQDDIVETFFLNVCYKGEISTMVPRQEMFNGLLTLIRPLALVEKAKVALLARELGLPVVPNFCPSAGESTREEIKTLLETLYRSNPNIRGNIMRALSHPRTEYLLGR
jgi:tRNA 2-thiocytidine biosynthesis protein TtcA